MFREAELMDAVKCRSCGAPIWWGYTKTGKRCPFNVALKGIDRTTEQPVYEMTEISHFTTCKDAKMWTRR
jgi:hypothetical protein